VHGGSPLVVVFSVRFICWQDALVCAPRRNEGDGRGNFVAPPFHFVDADFKHIAGRDWRVLFC